jgi:mannose-6-phosphate isomerase-like protein (cupin superfamily)
LALPVRTAAPEPIFHSGERKVEILVAREEITITRAEYAAGAEVAGPHMHHDHTDAFCVLAGTLTFEIGDDGVELAVSAGGFVAVPPHVPHAFRVDKQAPARWLTIHTPDGGFAAFIRGMRDGTRVDWDIHPVGGSAQADEPHSRPRSQSPAAPPTATPRRRAGRGCDFEFGRRPVAARRSRP